jgi:predicted ATP-grasp superfamily ATP-dependent carboligase
VDARVLLLVDEGLGALSAVRGLRAGGYEPYLGVSRPDTPAARSRAAAGVADLPDPFANPDRYVEEVAAAAKRLGVRAVLPGMESSLRALSGREHFFDESIAVGANPVEALKRATDKAGLEQLAAQAGLQAPKTIELPPGELDARAAEIVFPAVVKPLRSVQVDENGSMRIFKDVTRVESLDELRAAIAKVPGATRVVQTYHAGILGAVCGVAWNGQLVSVLHQESPRIWPPGKGISAFAVTVPPDVPRQAGVARMLKALDWSGVYGIQFILAEDGAYVIDLNPRIYGSIGLAIAAGHNLPAIWVDLLLGRDPFVRPYRVGVRYRVEHDDIRALLHLFRQGRRREALTELLPRPRTAHGLFSLRDPAPVLWTFEKVRARVKR